MSQSRIKRKKEKDLNIQALYENKPETIHDLKRPDLLRFDLPGGGVYYLQYKQVLDSVDRTVKRGQA